MIVLLRYETIKKKYLWQKSFILITFDNFDKTHLLLHYSKCLDVTFKHNHSSANYYGNELLCCAVYRKFINVKWLLACYEREIIATMLYLKHPGSLWDQEPLQTVMSKIINAGQWPTNLSNML